jgi:hypothetical protein
MRKSDGNCPQSHSCTGQSYAVSGFSCCPRVYQFSSRFAAWQSEGPGVTIECRTHERGAGRGRQTEGRFLRFIETLAH